MASANETKPKENGSEAIPNPNKKRKVAIFLSYVGHGYQGMQRNPGAKTIEDDLFNAIHRAGGISEANADERGYTKVNCWRYVFPPLHCNRACQLGQLLFVPPEMGLSRHHVKTHKPLNIL